MSNKHCKCKKCRCTCCLCQKKYEEKEKKRRGINEKLGTDFDTIEWAERVKDSEIIIVNKTISVTLDPKDLPSVKFLYPFSRGKVAVVVASCEIQIPENIKGLVSDISFSEPNTCFFVFEGIGFFSSFEEILEDLFYSHTLQVAHMKCISAKELNNQTQNGYPFTLYKTTNTPTTISIKYSNMVQVKEYGDMKLAYL